MSEHVSGPWRWSCDSFDPDATEPDQCSVGKIARWGGFYIAHISSDVPNDERRATARLIASAPDLLEALEEVRGLDNELIARGGPSMPKDMLQKVDQALTKARGES